jgi:ribosomal protein L37AE/L43A
MSREILTRHRDEICEVCRDSTMEKTTSTLAICKECGATVDSE